MGNLSPNNCIMSFSFCFCSVYPGSFQDWKARDGPVEKFSASSLDFTQRVTFDTKPTKDEK